LRLGRSLEIVEGLDVDYSLTKYVGFGGALALASEA
jgi:hypothetical protein